MGLPDGYEQLLVRLVGLLGYKHYYFSFNEGGGGDILRVVMNA